MVQILCFNGRLGKVWELLSERIRQNQGKNRQIFVKSRDSVAVYHVFNVLADFNSSEKSKTVVKT